MSDHAHIAAWLQEVRAFKADLLDGQPFAQMVSLRMQSLGVEDPRAYLEVLRTSPDEVEQLADGVAVQESWLFRYPASYEALAEHLRRVLMDPATNGSLEMISIGCARGEEPVSMAVTARQAGWPAERIQITALDASGEAIAQARAGVYGHRAMRERPAWVDDWIACAADAVHVAPELLGTIDYRHADVLRDATGWPTRPKVIFCRNVMIYLDEAARKRLLARILDVATPGSWLMLGHSEHVDLGQAYEAVAEPGAFAWRRVDPAARPAPLSPAPSRRSSLGSEPVPLRRALRPRRPAEPAPPVRPLPAADARDLADRGDLEAARSAARTLLEQQGPNADTLALLGSIEMALGAVDEARLLFRKAVYLDPAHEEARLQLDLINERPRSDL